MLANIQRCADAVQAAREAGCVNQMSLISAACYLCDLQPPPYEEHFENAPSIITWGSLFSG